MSNQKPPIAPEIMLWLARGPMYVADLVRATGRRRQRVHKSLLRLETQGLVEREQCQGPWHLPEMPRSVAGDALRASIWAHPTTEGRKHDRRI